MDTSFSVGVSDSLSDSEPIIKWCQSGFGAETVSVPYGQARPSHETTLTLFGLPITNDRLNMAI